MTHNKNLNSFLNLLINYILARSAPQLFSLKDGCTFRFLNFVKFALCNSSANYLLFKISSFLIPLPGNLFARVADVFLSKNL